MHKPHIVRYENTNNFEVIWIYNNPKEKQVNIYVDGIRKIRGKDFALGFYQGQIIIYFNEDIPADSVIELDVI